MPTILFIYYHYCKGADMKCNYIHYFDGAPYHQKPQGTEFVKEIEAMGFELPLGAVMHLWDGRYESWSINKERDVFTLKIWGYDQLVIYKTKFTLANTIVVP